MGALAVQSHSKEDLTLAGWHRNRLTPIMHSGQITLNQMLKMSPRQLFVGNVSRQWGKSYWAVAKAIELANSKPKARIKYATAMQTDLVEFILPTFDVVLETCPQHLRPKWKVQGSKWIFANGSEIKLIGLDKSPNSLRGNVIDMIIIDEAGFVGDLDYLYKSIIVPATLHRPNCRILMLSTPPSTPAHSFVDFAQKAEAEGGYAKLDIYTNPLITQDDINRMAAELGGFESTSFRRECLCEFVTDEGSQLIPEWDQKFVVANEPNEFRNYYHNYVSMDLGVKDFTLILFGYYDFKRATLVIEDEIKLNGPTLTTQIIHDSTKAFEKRMWPWLEHDEQAPRTEVKKVYRRVADNNNPQLLQDLSLMHHMSFISTDKDRLETMINETRMMVQQGRVEVHPRCTQLIGCLQYGVWDKKKKAFARSMTYGHFDALAALVYLCRNIDYQANPVPYTHGFDVRNAVIKTPKRNNENTRLMGILSHSPTKRI